MKRLAIECTASEHMTLIGASPVCSSCADNEVEHVQQTAGEGTALERGRDPATALCITLSSQWAKHPAR